MALILQFLGLPQAFLDGKPLSTDRRKAIALLVYLAVNDVGRPRQKYSRESLSALLWPDYDQAKAFSNLRTILWELRQAMGEEWLIAERESVQLNPDAEIDLDVARFQDLLPQSDKQKDPAIRIPLLSEAVKLYRDHFLTGFSLKDVLNFNEWAFAESEELRHKLADALTMLSEDYCTLRQADKAVPYARRLVALDPLNEAAHRQLMEVYWQAGQHSAALKQYQTCEQTLREEMNLDPQPETRALCKKILKGEVKPVRVEKQTETVVPKNNLPLQLSSFIGREKEQDEIINLVKKNRLVSLVGVGGIGKTRLSIQAAFALLNDFPHGVWLVELAPLSDATLVPQAIVNTLGLIEQADRPPLTVLTSFLQDKHVLLILDNCEHLIQACAQLAEALLYACPDLHILATSREALEISGESLYHVPPLITPEPLNTTFDSLPQYESVQLFVERAQSAMRDFSLTKDNAHAVAQVCQQLDGIPLALELAAARVKVLRAEEIAVRLDDRFHLLTGGARTAMPRHQTLRATIDWSHDLLSEPEHVLLRRLSVFAGGWTLEAAESACEGEGIEKREILDLLTQLVNKSLILAERKQGQKTRYRMLETIRQYSGEKLWAAGEGEMMRQQHLTYFVDLAERAEPNLRAFDMVMWLDQLEAELDNIRAALGWAVESDVEAELRLASALLWFWHIRGRPYEGIDWLEQGLSIEAMERGDRAITPSRAMIRGKALNASGTLMGDSSNDKVAERFEESLHLFQELGPVGKQGMAYALLGSAGWSRKAITSTMRIAMQEQSLTWFREVGDKFGAAQCLMVLAVYARLTGDFERAMTISKEGLALRKEIGDKDGIAIVRGQLGYIALRQGDYQQARELYEESLAGFRELGNKWGFGVVLSWLSSAAWEQGNQEQATRTLEEALAIGQGLGDKSFIADRLDDLGKVAWAQGDYELATKRFEEALRISREAENKISTAFALQGLGRVAQSQEDFATARSFYSEAFMLSQEMSRAWIMAKHLAAFATLIAAQKQPGKAARLFGSAETLVPSIRLEMSAPERAEHDRAIAACHAALGKEAFAKAWAEGQAMSLEEAITYALQDKG